MHAALQADLRTAPAGVLLLPPALLPANSKASAIVLASATASGTWGDTSAAAATSLLRAPPATLFRLDLVGCPSAAAATAVGAGAGAGVCATAAFKGVLATWLDLAKAASAGGKEHRGSPPPLTQVEQHQWSY